jgi:cell division protein FtsB
MSNHTFILKQLFKKLRNPFVITGLFFGLWMLFFDTNSYVNQSQLSKTIDQLEKDRQHYKEEIKKDSIALDELSNSKGLEKFAREKYHMKKENEEIFLIVE